MPFAVLALLAANASAPQLISIEVGLVRVTPFRPGTQTPWAIPRRPSQSDPCGLLVPVATVAAGAATMGAGLAGGAVLKSLCTTMTDKGTATQAHFESDPSIYVRLVSDRMTFRSYTVDKTRSHRFKFRVVLPVAASPKAGLVLDVVDDDGSADEESKEVIGTVRLTGDSLLAAAKDGSPLVEKDNGVEKIEMIVSPAEAKVRTKTQAFDVSQGLVAVGDDFEVSAGEVVEVQAHGAYRLERRREPVTVAGYVGDAATNYPDEPFRSGPAGAAVVRIGGRRLLKGYLVTPCASFIAPFAGKLAVGVNNRRIETVRGDLNFDITVRPPTETEWKVGAAEHCSPKAEVKEALTDLPSRADATAVRLRQMGDQLAAAILGKLHPTGKAPVLKAVEARALPTGIAVVIASEWQGGILGNPYTTIVRWEFNERRHIATVVPKDTAAIVYSADALKALDRYFESQLYPAMMK